MEKQLKDIVKLKFNKQLIQDKKLIQNKLQYNKKFKLKKFKKLYYIGTFKKTLNNFFITIINNKGQVIISQSAGNCKIFSKKKKKSFDTIKAIALSIAKIAILKNIKFLKEFYITHLYFKNTYTIINAFRSMGLLVKNARLTIKKIHGNLMRKKKIRRI